MKAPIGIDPDVKIIVEILQHAGEIVSRLPHDRVRGYLEAAAATDPDPWTERAAAAVRAAAAFELAMAELSAEEARVPPISWPDDALPSG